MIHRGAFGVFCFWPKRGGGGNFREGGEKKKKKKPFWPVFVGPPLGGGLGPPRNPGSFFFFCPRGPFWWGQKKGPTPPGPERSFIFCRKSVSIFFALWAGATCGEGKKKQKKKKKKTGDLSKKETEFLFFKKGGKKGGGS